MNTQKAYIEGFVKRANEYGYSDAQAIQLLKEAHIAMDPSGLRALLPQLVGGFAGTVAFPDHPVAGAAGGSALGAAIGIPWSLHHLKSRSREQHKNKNTSQNDLKALEHYYPELANQKD